MERDKLSAKRKSVDLEALANCSYFYCPCPIVVMLGYIVQPLAVHNHATVIGDIAPAAVACQLNIVFDYFQLTLPSCHDVHRLCRVGQDYFAPLPLKFHRVLVVLPFPGQVDCIGLDGRIIRDAIADHFIWVEAFWVSEWCPCKLVAKVELGCSYLVEFYALNRVWLAYRSVDVYRLPGIGSALCQQRLDHFFRFCVRAFP